MNLGIGLQLFGWCQLFEMYEESSVLISVNVSPNSTLQSHLHQQKKELERKKKRGICIRYVE